MSQRRDLIFRVFVSSTFSDLKVERDALQKEVFPELRKYCQERNARFQAIDLRWGVSQEAALDHQTMNICFQELARCQEMSPRPNFIVLLGDRYGWRPLPAQIPAQELEEILGKILDKQKPLLCSGEEPVSWQDGGSTQRIGWYRKDLNAVPPEYTLQPRTITFPENCPIEDRKRIIRDEADDWYRVESEMRALILTAIDALGWPKEDPRRAKYEQSATHQEIEHGALSPELDAEKHVFVYFREITGAPDDELVSGYIDTGKDKDSLNELKGHLEERLPKNHVYRYEATWKGNRSESDLKALCEQVSKDLRDIIDAELQAFQQRADLKREKEAHHEFAEERSRYFIGRQDILGRIKDCLNDPQDKHPLVIHGISGTGKTALIAQAWLRFTDHEQTIARFIGATPGSADLRSLLRSLCQQLGMDSPPSDMNDLVKAFRERLVGAEQKKEETKPSRIGSAVVFLDALDQLNPTDNARMLYWLPRELTHGVKLVVSTLQADGSTGECFDIARRIWPDSLVEVGTLGVADGKALLESWLDEAKRTLQEEQRNDVLVKFGGDGRPLYLKVAFEGARQWKSWEDLPSLSNGIEGILEDMLSRLEQPSQHGKILVERALSNITAANNGLTEDELLDVLSADEEVIQDYLTRNPESPKVDRLPVVIWSRLYADLKSYMSHRRADGTIVMNFYHRQMAGAVEARYFGKDEAARLAAHVRLAEYFHSLDYWAEHLEAQRARAKRLPPTPRPANVRKVVELPYHRLEAAKLGGKDDAKSPYWDAVTDLLTDWQFLEAKAEADPNFQEQESTGIASETNEAKQ